MHLMTLKILKRESERGRAYEKFERSETESFGVGEVVNQPPRGANLKSTDPRTDQIQSTGLRPGPKLANQYPHFLLSLLVLVVASCLYLLAPSYKFF